jgi:hypothetical protein
VKVVIVSNWIISLLLLCSCEATGWQDTRRPIEDEGELRVIVRVRLDWNQASLEPGRVIASVWFFPESGEHPRVLTTDELLDSIALPPDNYRILAFNGLLEYASTRDEQTSSSFRNIGFRGTGRYETFEAFCRNPLTLSAAYSRPAETSTPMAAPETLTADHYHNSETGDVLHLTMEMVDRDVRPTLEFTPVRLTAQVQLVAHVENLVSAATFDGANVAAISGLAESVLLASGKKGTTPVTHYFTINHRQYDEGSEVNGTLRGDCFTFGLPGASTRADGNENLLNLYFTLRDGTPHPAIERDITGHFMQEEQGDGKIQLTLRVEVGEGRLGPDDYIHLPDTQDPGSDGSDFDADVDKWGNNVTVPIGL